MGGALLGISRSEYLVRFDNFELDTRTGELSSGGAKVVCLSEQTLRVIIALLEHPGELVLREDLRKRLWPNDTVVEFENSINASIKKLRQVLGDQAENPRFIETLVRRGYRWKTEVEWLSPLEPIKPPASANSNLPGKKILHYRVLSLLGGGGMGLVYRAEDLKLNRPVALKFLPDELASDPVTLRRFEREARTASSLNHPNICTIHAVEEHEGQPFIVMELLDGESLRELISSRFSSAAEPGGSQLPLDQLLEIAIQIAEGLDAAHHKGIIHRDIKPANIFVISRQQVKILDFGLAKTTMSSGILTESLKEDGTGNLKQSSRQEGGNERDLSRTGITMGTAAYMSPEQVRGEELDARTDLFSFGLVMFEMATGQRAFSGDTAAVVHDAILHHELPPVTQLNPKLPVPLEEIIGKALEKDRELRYQSAAEMLAELNSALRIIQAGSPAAPVDAPAIRGESRRAARLLSLVFVPTLLLALCLIGWNRWVRSPRGEFPQIQLTPNSGDNPVTSAVISGDGRYLLYADNTSIHIKSMEKSETRDLPHPPEFGRRHVFWDFSWFPDNVHFLAVSRGSYPNRTDTWLGSVGSETLRKLRGDSNAWDISPDGSRVVFSPSGDREVWVMDAAGEGAQQLFDAGKAGSFQSVQWSPDGTRLLDLRESEGSGRPMHAIEIRDLNGAPPAVLLTDERIRDLHWLKDGRILYLLGEPGRLGMVCDYWTTRLDARGTAFDGKPEQITHSDGFCMGHASSTNDGRKLVFTRYTSAITIAVADLDASGTRITPPRHFSLIEGREFPDGWTADSREVIFTSNRDQMWGVYRRPVGGGPTAPILTEHSPDLNIGFVTTSPDGNWIFYFQRSKPTLAFSELMKAPMDGGAPSTIYSGSFIDTPRCSHAPANLCAVAWVDKDELVFTSFDAARGLGRELGRVRVDHHETYGWVLSPDGSRIAVRQAMSSTFDLLEWKTGKQRTVRADGWSMLMTMDWAPDSKSLFMSAVEPASTLLHVDLSGHAIVLWEPQGTYVTWAMASPDGRHLAMPARAGTSNAWMLQNF